MNTARASITVLAGGKSERPRRGSGGGATHAPAWQDELLRTREGDCRATAGNLQLILRNDEAVRGLFRYNEFTARVDVVGDVPGPVALPQGPLTDAHLAALGAWLSSKKTYALSAKPPQIAEAIALAAHEYAFHPVRDYLRSLAWDGTPRIETLFASYLGARGSAYESRVAQMLFVSIVARVFQPGRKVDTVVVFESLEQGTGKTTFIHALLRPDWCVDPVETIGSRDFLMAIRGAAIVELGELSVFSRADFAKIKQAITVQVDTYRDPFARCVASYPRQCVFVGSTNQDDWNRDPTGARRFLPVRVSAIDLDGYLSVRDQVWAEAVHLFDAGTDYWTLPATAAAEVDERFDDDPWLDPIAYWLAGKCEDKKYPVEIDMRSTADGGGVRRVPAALLMQHALGIETGKHTRAEWSRVVSVMRRLGWRKERVMRNGVRAWEYVRPTEDADVVPF